jgi:hypothetical protein
MGCCSITKTEALPKRPEDYLNSLSASIDENNIDKAVLTIDNTRLNALSFSLISGNILNFTYLLNNMNASVSAMELLLEQQGFNGLDIVIEKGNVEMLKFYFPIYQASFPQRFLPAEDLETSDSTSNSRVSRKLPVHIATEKGFLEVLKFLHQAFQGKFVPDKYNLHYVDEYSGENSALISCRKGFLHIVKFLFEECAADFNVKSKRFESALQLAAFGSKANPQDGFEVFRYLVEKVKVDPGFQYEEVLLILDDQRIVKYFEEELKKIGIRCSKEEVEGKYSISSYAQDKNRVLYGYVFEASNGGLSSIDVNMTVGASLASFIHELESNDN